MSALTVLAEQPGWLAIDKPPGAVVIPGRTPEAPALRERLEGERGEKLYVVHRLDRDTSGVLLFARNPETHRALSMAFEAGRIRKRYHALVEGAWSTEASIDVALTAARKGRMRPVREGEAGKPARTRFRPLETFVRATWVEAEPLTGRTHQIRVHARCAGHPLLVDPHYGAEAPRAVGTAMLQRTPLHAARLELPSDEGLNSAVIEAPLPEDLRAVLDALRSGAEPAPA